MNYYGRDFLYVSAISNKNIVRLGFPKGLQYTANILHSGRMDSKNIHSTIDAPPGVPGVSKNQIFLQIKLLSFCTRIAPKRHKLQKIIKIGEKFQKTPVFLDLFEYSSIWGQY